MSAADETVERGGHVGRREVGAVVPRDALAQVERPDAAVLVRLPRLGEPGRDVAVVAERGEELEALGDRCRRCRGPASRSGRAGRPASAWRPGSMPPVAGSRVPRRRARRLGAGRACRCRRSRSVSVLASSSSPPQAAMTAPRNGTDRPMTVPRRTKSRRLMRPSAYDSIRSSPSGPTVRRARSKRFQSMLSPLFSWRGTCWLAPPAGRTLTAGCGTVNRRSRYGCTVNGTMTGMAAYESGRVPRVVVGAAGAESVADFVADRGASAAALIVDESAVANGYVDGIVAALAASLAGPKQVERYVVPAGEPDASSVDAAADLRARGARSDRDRRRRRQRARHRQAGGGRRHGGDGRRALRARRQPAARPPPDDRHPHHRRHGRRGDADLHRDRPRRAQGVDVGRRAAARSGGARPGVDRDDAGPRHRRHRPRRVRPRPRGRQRAAHAPPS